MARSSSRSLWTAKLRDGVALDVKTSVARTRKSPTKAMTSSRGAKAIILGIDPSLRGTGLAVIDTRGSTPRLLASLTLKLAPKLEPYRCLGRIAHLLLGDGLFLAGQDAIEIKARLAVLAVFGVLQCFFARNRAFVAGRFGAIDEGQRGLEKIHCDTRGQT